MRSSSEAGSPRIAVVHIRLKASLDSRVFEVRPLRITVLLATQFVARFVESARRQAKMRRCGA